MMSFNRFRIVALTLFAGAIILPQTLSGQDEEKKYLKDSIDSSLIVPKPGTPDYATNKRNVDKELTSLESDTRKILKGDLDFGPNQARLNKYMNQYFLPRMTHYDDISISIGKERDKLIRELLKNASNPTARDYLLDSILFPFAQKVCEGNYHPAARVNAMYIIANLNRRHQVPRASLPTLMTEALNYMIQTIDAADKPMFLKVPALQGIERHVGIDQLPNKQIDATTRGGIRDRMLKLVQQPYTGKKNDDDLLYYRQRIATRILGSLKDPGTGNAVATQLKSMIANEKLKVWLRHDAIAAFGKLQFTNDDATKVIVKDMIDQSIKFVSGVARKQAASIEFDVLRMKENFLVFTGKDLAKVGVKSDTSDELENVSMGTGGDFEFGDDTTNSDDTPKVELPNYRLNLFRRELKTLSETTVLAIVGSDMKVTGGLAAMLSPEEGAAIMDVASKIRKMMRDVDVALFGDEFDARDPKLTTAKSAMTDRLKDTLVSSANDLDQVAAESKKSPERGPAKGGGDTKSEVSPLDGGK